MRGGVTIPALPLSTTGFLDRFKDDLSGFAPTSNIDFMRTFISKAFRCGWQVDKRFPS
jgi:hypothetical protein